MLATACLEQNSFLEKVECELLGFSCYGLDLSKPQTPRLSKKKLAQVVDLLLEHHHTPIPAIPKNYNISIVDIQTGVQCPRCRKFPIKYCSASWHCPRSRCTSKTA